MKRIVLMLMAFLLIFNFTVFADECAEYNCKTDCCNKDSFIKGYILNGIIQKHSEIDFSGFELCEEEIKGFIKDVIEENPKNAAGVLSYNVKGNFAQLKYDDVLNLLESAAVSAEKAKILSLIDDDMTDMEKALVVHDYMVQNYEFDLTYSIYSAEGMFENKTGVCEAYALAYMEIMTTLGIECLYVPSYAMNHAWNLVKIDGEWYHVDTTWDDPTPDLLGRVSHVYFLISDAAIADASYSDGVHYGWEIDKKATSTKYDKYFWYDIEKPIVDHDGFWYFIRETDTKPVKGQIIRKNISTGAESAIYTIEDHWFVWGDSKRYWPMCFSGIGIIDDRIYFNTPQKIQSVNLNGTSIKTEFTPNTSTGYIYGFIVSDKKLIYGLSTSPNNGIESKGVHYVQYSIIFDANGGDADFAYKNISYGAKYGVLPEARREGYIFKGWYTAKNGGVLVTENTTCLVRGDQTLYAVWEKIPPQMETKAEKKDGKYTIKVETKWVDKNSYIYVACFTDGKLSGFERRLLAKSTEEFSASGDASEIKVMLWSCDRAEPMCGETVIK